ncbi:DUF92 domain-containing protein [Cytobacillus purgationiresistens]|uniref:Uncharacterized protein (TIGR00297 family) n=1 Tax=Cytobacillus purgationiresistens TaxID=863449 RepID=A0ABU0ADX0_9BACI|nr:DUF92 domain-containing protein [Cytobacillus purgationiresistens]MDQ0269443.1 uncharacterized protein (TIGR00297 family) [Cytobacillus purgationiresistens]
MIGSILLVIFVASISLAGYYLRLLTKSGSIAAFFVGVSVSLGFGLQGLLLLGFFFASSSFWSKFKSKKKESIEDRHEKGSTRDWQQVVANGGLAALFSLLYAIHPSDVFLLGFLISLASANADTWASELGSLSKKPPLFIRTLKPIETGTSGAVSLLGTAAALAGSFTLVLLACLLMSLSLSIGFIVFIFGFLGNIVDSFLGAYSQVIYRCLECGKDVEGWEHCGQRTSRIRGISFMNNDAVNFLSALIAVIIGVTYYQFLLL